jgi:predicted transposase/invertase (TIGR01784 family)
LETGLDCWLFCFKNFPTLKERPPGIKGEIFDLLFEVAEINKLTTEDMKTYKKSLVRYNDVELVAEYYLKEGREEGREEGIFQVAANLLKIGLPVEDIAKGTGLSPEQILQL